MKNPILLVVALCAFALGQSARCGDLQKIAYPTADHASFIIDAPNSWKLEPAEEEGDFFQLEGPTGALFSFRTIEGSKKSLDKAIDESVKELNKRFSDMQLGDAQDWKPDGLTGLYAVGTGKAKDGTAVKVGVGWVAVNDGKIAEMWFVADADDAKGMKQAEDIANSLTSPQPSDESSASDSSSDSSSSDNSSDDSSSSSSSSDDDSK
jgi:hypothetical protein